MVAPDFLGLHQSVAVKRSMMFKKKTNFPLLVFFSFMLIALVSLTLTTPRPIKASPNFGITPTATPEPPPPTPTPQPPPDDDDGDSPTESVEVQLGCNLTCGLDGQSITTQVSVRLVHRGSGWIAEGTVSNTGSTTFQVPYGDEWEVYMVSEPQFASVDEVGLVNAGAQMLGVVQANSGVQFVDCPVACPEIPPPTDLPTTGRQLPDRSANAVFNIMLMGLILIISGGLILSKAWRTRPPQKEREK
jgi:hypothetical protein